MPDQSDSKKTPPTLSDVLAAIVMSVSRARSSADIGSMHVARLYRSHEFLRGLPVPRLRIHKAAVSLPMIVTGVRPGVPAERNPNSLVVETTLRYLRDRIGSLLAGRVEDLLKIREAVGADDSADDEHRAFEDAKVFLDALRAPATAALLSGFLTTAYQDAEEELAARGSSDELAADIDVRAAFSEATSGILERQLRSWYQNRKRGLSVNSLAADSSLKDALDDEDEPPLKKLVDLLRSFFIEIGEFAGDLSLKTPTSPPEVEITVDTANVRNVANPNSVTRLEFSLVEEGLEWVAEGQGDDVKWKLLPE